MTPPLRAGLCGLLLAGFAFVLYQNAFSNPFLYDDRPSISDNTFLRDSRHFGGFFRGQNTSSGTFHGHFRPLAMLSFALNYRWGRLDPWGYRLFNFGLHLLCSLLVFLVSVRLLRCFDGGGPPSHDPSHEALPHAAPSWDADKATTAGLFAATIFALHPLTSQSILLVWKRTSLWAACFYLLGFLAYLGFEGEGKREAPSAATRLGFGGLVLGCFGCAMAAKETAITFPAFLLLFALWPRPSRPQWDRQRLAWNAGLHLALWGLVALLLALFFPEDIAKQARATTLQYLFTQAKVLWLYLAMFFAPTLIAANYDIQLVRGLDDPLSWLGGAGICGLLLGALWWARRWPLPSFLVWCFFLALAPTSSFVANPLLADENRMYIPLLFLLLPVGAGLARAWHGNTKARRYAVAALVGLALIGCSMVDAMRVVTWSKETWLWQDALEKYPDAPHATVGLCQAYSKNPKTAHKALPLCKKALKLGSHPLLVYDSIVASFFAQRMPQHASTWAARALAEHPYDYKALKLAGKVAWFRRRFAKAIPYFERALEKKPRDPQVTLYLVDSLRRFLKLERARHHLGRIDGLRFAHYEDRIFRAFLHQRLGQHQRACAIFRDVARRPRPIPPNHRGKWMLLARGCAQR